MFVISLQPGGAGRDTEMFGSSPGQARLGHQALKRRVVMRQLVVIADTDNTSHSTPGQSSDTTISSVTTLLSVCKERGREDSFPHYCEVDVALSHLLGITAIRCNVMDRTEDNN